MKVAVITVNYNGKKDTLEFLESLNLLQTTNYQLRTIVVDNASSDGSVSAIHQAFPEVDIIQAGGNLGFSGGYNRGLDYAKNWGADYFLLINNDCTIKNPDLLGRLLETINSDPAIGLVSPKIYFAPGFEFHKNLYSKDEVGRVIWFAGGKFDWNNIGSVHRGIDQADEGDYTQVEEQEIVSGACVLIKKEVFQKIGPPAGGFDEKYFLYFEDSDFIKRAKDSGFKTYYDGRVSVYHKVSQSTGIGSEITDYYHTRNRLIFGMRYGCSRTKFALLREAVKLFLLGRPAQRQGVLDYYLGITGGAKLLHIGSGTGLHIGIEYPLKLSIGIVNYNTPLLTKNMMESIFNKTSGFDPENMEVIVLDNGQKDPCRQAIKEFLPKIKYLENKENEGFSKGYNRTIRFSLGEYYLMLNSDIEVLKGGISELIKGADQLKGEAVLGGKLEFPDGSEQDSAFNLPTLSGAFKEYFLAQKGSYFMYEPSPASPGRSQSPPSRWLEGHLRGVAIKVEGLVMACMLIPKNIINKAGMLDEGTFIFFEDIEYCRRLNRLGVPIYFVPQAKFIHHHGSSTKKIGQGKAYEHLKKASEYYHGKFYYSLLTFVLRLGQKLGRVKTPVSRWTQT